MECEHDFVFDELHGEVLCRKCGHVLTAEEKRRICDHGIELLEAEEKEEYISRKSAEGAVRDHWCDSSRMMEAISRIPAADVAPVVHAKPVLIFDDPFTGRRFTTCSNCNGKIGKKDRYCKHCGAKMDL